MSGDRALREQFHETGIVRLDGAFEAGQAARIRQVIGGFLDRKHRIDLDQPATWPGPQHAHSFKSLKRNPAFAALIDNQAVSGALDALFAPGGWERPHPGAQVLLSFPSPGPWRLPAGGWHMDCGFDRPTWPVWSVKLFSFFDRVDAEGGGTLLLSGSHRLVERYAATVAPGTGGNKTTWGRFMRQDPWLARVYRGEDAGLGRDQLGQVHEVDGIPIEVVELSGEPGDVVITHLHVFHCVAPNTGTRPRQMLGKQIRAAA